MKLPRSFDKEPLLKAIGKIVTGAPTDQLMPVLIVVLARVLVLEADGDHDKLESLGIKFCDLLAKTATDMMDERSVH